jgi:thioredoxin
MDEGYAPPPGSLPRDLVDEVISRRPAGLQSLVQVRYAVADVVNARAPLGQELPDRAVSIAGGEQLDLALSEGECHDARAVHLLRRLWFETEDIAIKGYRRVEISDGNADMSNAGVVSQRLLLRTWSAPVLSGAGDRLSMENNAMGATNTLTVHVNDASFASEIEQAVGLVLVDFWASWCGPCQIVAPVLDQLAGEYAGKAKVAKVDVDANHQTTMRFNVRSIPSILFFKNGQHVDTVVGAVPKATLEGKIKQHLV